MRDATALMRSLQGRTLDTISGRKNRILRVHDDRVVVSTGRSPGGQDVPVRAVQAAVDELYRVGEVEISVAAVGYRSAFVGAVLAAIPGTELVTNCSPPRIRLLRGSGVRDRHDAGRSPSPCDGVGLDNAPSDSHLTPASDIPALLQGLCALERDLTRRELHIFAARRLVAPPCTLNDLALKLNISRERVRQIERMVSEQIDSPELLLSLRLSAMPLIEHTGPVTSCRRAEAGARLLGKGKRTIPSWYPRLLLISQGYRLHGRWLVEGTFVSDFLRPLADEVRGHPLPISELRARARASAVSPQLVVEWLREFERITVVGGTLMDWSGTNSDKAVRLIELARHPMTVDALLEAVGTKNRSSLAQALQRDERLRRVGRGTFGLVSWGGSAYTTISDAIATEVQRSGGEIEITKLTRVLSERHGVAAGSIRAYANGNRFETLATGMVRLRRTPRVIGTPVHSRSCYLHPEGWSLRIDIDHDVLRGSGQNMPDSFAVALGMRPLETVELDTPTGDITVGWTDLVAAFGSLRSVVVHLGAQPRDLLFCTALGALKAKFSVVSRATVDAHSGLERFLLEIGLDPEECEDQFVAACNALGVIEKGNARRSGLIRRLRLRGEQHLIALLAPEHRTSG
jgi:hypothetical protein